LISFWRYQDAIDYLDLFLFHSSWICDEFKNALALEVVQQVRIIWKENQSNLHLPRGRTTSTFTEVSRNITWNYKPIWCLTYVREWIFDFEPYERSYPHLGFWTEDKNEMPEPLPDYPDLRASLCTPIPALMVYPWNFMLWTAHTPTHRKKKPENHVPRNLHRLPLMGRIINTSGHEPSLPMRNCRHQPYVSSATTSKSRVKNAVHASMIPTKNRRWSLSINSLYGILRPESG